VDENRIELDRSDTGVVTIVLTGEHDVYTAPALRDQISAVVNERVPFVVDLSPATFIDSSVLRVLLEARREAEEEGLGFAVALESQNAPGVRRVLEVTGLVPVFPVLSSRADALNAARNGGASS
jgi:anti-sigma B factor antagonist